MTDKTIDGYPVEPGLLVWDYDLNPARVVGPGLESHGTIWYRLEKLDGSPSKDMDAGRMWVRHPSTGKRVQ